MTTRSADPGGQPGTGSPAKGGTFAIEAVGLTKSFGTVRALDGFGLTVSPGSVCALLGPNGAGKTTAIRILATLTRPDAGRARAASILIFPVTGLSNVFVPTSGMPAWLRLIADWNPVSALATAARHLFGNPSAPANGAWPLEHPVVASLGWTSLLLAVFVPLCTTRYARR